MAWGIAREERHTQPLRASEGHLAGVVIEGSIIESAGMATHARHMMPGHGSRSASPDFHARPPYRAACRTALLARVTSRRMRTPPRVREDMIVTLPTRRFRPLRPPGGAVVAFCSPIESSPRIAGFAQQRLFYVALCQHTRR